MTLENQPDLKNRFFINLFINSPIGIFVVQEGKFQFVNPKFQKISGHTEGELLGIESVLIILDEDIPGVKENAVNRKKGSVRDLEARFRMKSGEIRTMLWSAEIIDYGEEKAFWP